MSARWVQVAGAGMIAALLCVAAVAQSPSDVAFLRRILSEARTQAEQIQDEISRVVLLENLAAAEARAGNVKFALAEAERLEPSVKAPPIYGDCSYIYDQILLAQARSGNFDAAQETIQRISGRKDEAYYALAGELAKHGNVDRAIEAVEKTEQSHNVLRRAQVLLELGEIRAERGDVLNAGLLFERAESLAAQLLSQAGAQAATIELPLDVAVAMHHCGTSKEALRIFAETRRVIANVSNDAAREQYLSTFASAAAKAGELDLAKEVLDEISEPYRRAMVGAALTDAYINKPYSDVGAALKEASNIPVLEIRINSLASVASAQSRKGERTEARKTLQECSKQLQFASDDSKPWGALTLASAEYELGNRRRATRLGNEAIELTSRMTIHPQRERPHLLTYVARLRARYGDEAGALSVAKRCECDSIFEVIAEAETRGGRLNTAMIWIEKLGEPEQRGGALLGVARALLDQEESVRESKNISYPSCRPSSQ